MLNFALTIVIFCFLRYEPPVFSKHCLTHKMFRPSQSHISDFLEDLSLLRSAIGNRTLVSCIVKTMAESEKIIQCRWGRLVFLLLVSKGRCVRNYSTCSRGLTTQFSNCNHVLALKAIVLYNMFHNPLPNLTLPYLHGIYYIVQCVKYEIIYCVLFFI